MQWHEQSGWGKTCCSTIFMGLSSLFETKIQSSWKTEQ